MTATATDQGSRPRMRSSVPAGTTLARLRDEVIRPLWRWWAVAIAVVLVAMAPLLLGWTSGMNDDVYREHLPLYQWVWQTWLGGDTPWWTHLMFAGHNVSGMGQGGLFYPPNAVFAVFDVVVAFRWWVVGHLLIGTTGMFLWSWRSWRSEPGAVVSAIAYGLNGFIVLHLLSMNTTTSASWIPWFFLGIDLVIDRWSVKRALVLVIPLAVIAGAGTAQILWLVLLAAGVYTVTRLSRRGIGIWPWVHVGGATIAGLALSAVNLIPMLLFSRTSVRPTLTQTGAFEYAAQPRDLVTSVFPYIIGGGNGLLRLTGKWRGEYPYHEVANHIGIAVMALAIIGAVFTWRSRRTIAMAILAVFALFTAVGGSTPVGGLVFHLVPYADHFRVWSRNVVLLDLGFALVAGAGVRAILASTAIQRRRMLLGILIGSIVVTLFVLSNDLGGARVGGSDLQTVLLFALICLASSSAHSCSVMIADRRRSSSSRPLQ